MRGEELTFYYIDGKVRDLKRKLLVVFSAVSVRMGLGKNRWDEQRREEREWRGHKKLRQSSLIRWA